MKFEVLVEAPAAEEIEAGFLYLLAEASVEVAARWYNELETKIATLATMPRRCPVRT